MTTTTEIQPIIYPSHADIFIRETGKRGKDSHQTVTASAVVPDEPGDFEAIVSVWVRDKSFGQDHYAGVHLSPDSARKFALALLQSAEVAEASRRKIEEVVA